MLILRSGYGSADPHSRRGVARILDVRVQRVRRLEQRGLREARSLSRAGACGGGTAPASSPAAAGPTPARSPRRAAATRAAGGGGGAKPDTGAGNSRKHLPKAPATCAASPIRRLAPPSFGGGTAQPGGVSLAIGIALIVLALAAGFATPHLRGRLRSS